MADSGADSRLFIYTFLLLSIGVVMSYSLSAYSVLMYNYGSFHFFLRELIAGIFGIFIMWIFSQIDPNRFFLKIGFALFFISFIMLVIMPFLPDSLTSSAGGAKRWMRFPFISFAPSEFFKIGFVFFLAWSFSRKFVDNNPAQSHKKF